MFCIRDHLEYVSLKETENLIPWLRGSLEAIAYSPGKVAEPWASGWVWFSGLMISGEGLRLMIVVKDYFKCTENSGLQSEAILPSRIR